MRRKRRMEKSHLWWSIFQGDSFLDKNDAINWALLYDFTERWREYGFCYHWWVLTGIEIEFIFRRSG